jgi:hypothetical protein
MKAVHPKNDQATLPVVEWLRAAKILELDDIHPLHLLWDSRIKKAMPNTSRNL